ncbi:hypothetical protein [Paraburkholderia sediminicola]|uniref:hypothetical protein n=1 Tax=Paraburkholderia sediminicola TaxID=458836 RepID=UPI0038B6CD46
MVDVDTFTDDQKRFLSRIVSDFGGPTTAGSLLRVLESALYELKPDWQLELGQISDDLKSDLEVCIAALQYLKVKDVAES